MNLNPLVSILINNYNYGKFLLETIDSALGQTYQNIEVIVVDDGSTDNSREVIDGYGDRIVSVFKDNGGQASAMNAGFAASKGEIICLLDADDLFLPERIAEVVKLFNLDSNISWVFTESAAIGTKDINELGVETVFDNIRKNDAEQSPKEIDFRENIKKAHLPNFTPSTSNLCFSRKILEKIFPLPEIKGISGMAISDMYINLIAVGLSAGCITVRDLGVFRIHNNNTYTNKTIELSKKRRMFAERHITTGYWMKTNFPELEKMSKKLLSKGYSTYLSSNYSGKESNDANCEELVKDYLASASFLEKFEIRLMTLYYSLKLRSAELV